MVTAWFKPDLAIAEPVLHGFADVIDRVGGISLHSGPQIERAIIAVLVQVAIQRGITPYLADEWAKNISQELIKAHETMWKTQP